MDYAKLPSREIIEKVAKNFVPRNVTVHIVENKAEALEKVRSLLPDGVEVMTASSMTLDQIGFVDILKSKDHPWNNLKDAIAAETDPIKQGELRKKSITAGYFLGSVHAITEAGETLTASGSGSQIPGYAFASDNVIWVASANKIVPDIDVGLKRIREHSWVLEDARVKSTGGKGSDISKILIFEQETRPNRHIHLVLVNEVLGF